MARQALRNRTALRLAAIATVVRLVASFKRSAGAPVEDVVDGPNNQRNVDAGAARNAFRASQDSGTPEVDVDQRDQLVDGHIATPVAIASALHQGFGDSGGR